MESTVSHFGNVYKKIQQIPSPVNAKLLPGDHPHLLSVHTNWKSQDFVTNERNSFSRDYVLQIDNFTVLSSGIPYSSSNVHLKAFSKSGHLYAVLRDQKASESLFLEIWNKSQKLKTFDMTEREEHGKLCESDPFMCFEWSSDDKYLLYTAEKKVPKSVSFFKDVPPKKESEEKPQIRGEEYAYKQEWGECCVGYHHSVLCVFDLESGKVRVLQTDKIGLDVSIGQAVWSPDDKKIFFTAWDETPYRLGVWACRNRRSQIYSLDLSNDEVERITTKNDICVRSLRFSPDHSSLVYLESAASGPHFKGSKLQMYTLKNKSVSTVVDLVNSAAGLYADFPGLYADNLPTRCWSQDGKYIFFSTVWRSSSANVCADVENGNLQRLNIGPEFGSASILDVHNDVIISEVSSPNIEPCLAVGSFKRSGEPVVEWKFLDVNAPVKHTDIEWKIKRLQPKTANEKYSNLDYEIILINQTEKKKSPLIIMPHGGPHSCYVAGFPFRSIGHVKLGYKFCLVNYRGSVGFGEDSVNSLLGNVGKQDVEDVHDAVLYIKEQEKDNIGDIYLLGGSHGGFLSAHLIGQYPDFYKAACLLNPVIDISAMVGVTDIPDWCYVEGGDTFKVSSAIEPEILKNMWEKSPIKYVDHVKTPTLLLLGKKDLRVPPSQGYRYYQLLKARNVPVKLFHYDDNHQLLKTPHDGEVFMQTALWFLSHSTSQLIA